MKLTDFAIQQLLPYINVDEHPPRRSGPDLVRLFNKFGASDIYDFDNGRLPDIGKKSGHRSSRTQYVEARLILHSTLLELQF